MLYTYEKVYFHFRYFTFCLRPFHPLLLRLIPFRLLLLFPKQCEKEFFRISPLHVIANLCYKNVLKGSFHKENEPLCEKTGFLHMRKQRRRSASR